MLVRLRLFSIGAALASVCASGIAAEVAVVGMIGTRAILVVNDGAPQTVAVGGRSREGVRVLGVDGDVATLEVDGKRQRIRMGERVVRREGGVGEGLVLQADSRGHFLAQGRINGNETGFLVDTGATLVSLGKSDAQRAGVDFTKGSPGRSVTANGTVRVWRVQLDTLELGGMRVHNVEAAVHEQDLPFALLGMSFLNRMHWQREGDKLILRKRY